MQEIVIKIPEGTYKDIIKNGFIYDEDSEVISHAIINGIVLPKGHGNMVDRDAINSRFYDIWKELESYSNKPSYKDLLDKWSMCIDTAPIIIEADRSEE